MTAGPRLLALVAAATTLALQLMLRHTAAQKAGSVWFAKSGTTIPARSATTVDERDLQRHSPMARQTP